MKKITILWAITEPDAVRSGLNAIIEGFEGVPVHLVALFTPYYNPNPVSHQAIAYAGYGAMSVATHLMDTWRKQTREDALKAREIITEFVMPVDSSCEWREDFGYAESAITYQSLYADVVVMIENPVDERKGFVKSQDRSMISYLLNKTSTPLLLLPSGKKLQPLFSNPLIAWKATPEAAAAVKFMVNMTTAENKKVRIVHIVSGKEKESMGSDVPVDVATYLTRSGFEVNEHLVDSCETGTGEAILKQGYLRKASLVVMGAYSRSKWIEKFFGGVTEHMLKKSDIPLLLTH